MINTRLLILFLLMVLYFLSYLLFLSFPSIMKEISPIKEDLGATDVTQQTLKMEKP